MGEWYCALLNNKALRGVKDVRKHVNLSFKSIFGKDLCDVCVPGEQLTDKLFELESENYVFFCCKNYTKHCVNVKKHSLIRLVLPETNHPEAIDKEEIESFTSSIMEVHSSEVNLGDEVKVREGYLKNLYGVVLEELEGDRYRVAFYLHTRIVEEEMRKNNLVSVGTIFKHFRKQVILRKPVILDKRGRLPRNIDKKSRKILKEEGFEDTIHRRHTRKPAKKKRTKKARI